MTNQQISDLDSIVIKPIRTEEEYIKASQIIENLVDADLIEDESIRNKALDILEAVTVLAIEYEKKHYPVTKLDAIDAIKQRLEMLNLSQKEVAQYFGGENRVSEILNRKRPLTLKVIKNLYHHLGIPAEILLAM
ncbi:helix-turn-helix domain-containing protein [Flectobacillus roseus]|uniref:Helix-turn-helix domain-containing protein n=1 Tax=Flectobacillus roseus TaxID=502259 RepID=A0ABT6YA95_9BACT|nr:helix-turn-helix domain-containing protein [Flectobacillus roseus]MDI9860512.1 helix-turn-helix domain-containing protein [Flectobacillus roseus]MDI9869903.1 helix-turn-helix domain-containing protein [Flectobacillus roseus]